MRHLLAAALLAAWGLAPAHAASPTVAAVLLDEGDTVTLIEAYTVSAETLDQLSLPALPSPDGAPELIALQARSLAQWADAQAIFAAAGHAPLPHRLQRVDGERLVSVGPEPLPAGRYLLQVTTPRGETVQQPLDLSPRGDGLSSR